MLRYCLIIILAPLLGSILAGFFRKQLGKNGAHCVTIAGVGLSFLVSLWVATMILSGQWGPVDVYFYTWANGGDFFPYSFHLGFLVDPLTVMMLVIVTFVSLLVHIYSIGYMAEDDGYQRFFSYISLFTFMMLMLVTADNFLQLFFGWEGVGLVSYLLIGFWFKKESANQGSMKAFIVNRVGDFGFVLGIALILAYVGSLDYQTVFSHARVLNTQTIELFSGHPWTVVTVTTMLLYIGAMGKSAQVPLHIWLPESMEGPTPISALIHAATMVTAGVFMMARISPLLEFALPTLSVILVIGATGALFTGILALVMNDIKRVVAYSTLSQLGYMMVAMGVSAYSTGMFHLLTHACFKALLFLAAGSVIMGMHHEQDMRKMGGLWRKMPITYVTFLIGSLALCAIPPFSGFYSKETIITATHLSTIPGSSYAYFCVSLGAMVTALYTFRAFFMTFHGKSHVHDFDSVHESPRVVWLPLVLLAIPSVVLGYLFYNPLVLDTPSLLSSSLFVLPEHNVMQEIAHEASSPWVLTMHAPFSIVFWITLLGIFLAWIAYNVWPAIPSFFSKRFSWIYRILLDKYGFDAFNNIVFIRGLKSIGRFFYRVGDKTIIDGFMVNGTARSIGWLALKGRAMQNGYLYHYITIMVIGLLALLSWQLLR